MGAVRAAGGLTDKPTPMGQGGEAAWRGRGVIAAGGEGVQVQAAATDHGSKGATERKGAVPVRSHAPGYGGTRVMVHGLGSAGGGLGASAAA